MAVDFKLSAWERIQLLTDPDTFKEFAEELRSADPLSFVDRATSYARSVADKRAKTGLEDAAVVGRARIDGLPVVLAVFDFNFIGGSMGSVVGEKLTRAIEMGERERTPVIIVSASGGARMQEGMYSLMQMAKTSAALGRLAEAGVPYISVLTGSHDRWCVRQFRVFGGRDPRGTGRPHRFRRAACHRAGHPPATSG